jgi:hypothetical protein
MSMVASLEYDSSPPIPAFNKFSISECYAHTDEKAFLFKKSPGTAEQAAYTYNLYGDTLCL